jgi:hypothetical protein
MLAVAASPHHNSCHVCRSAPHSVDKLALTVERPIDSVTGQLGTKSKVGLFVV